MDIDEQPQQLEINDKDVLSPPSASPSPGPVPVIAPSPSQVFAPRPVRPPFPLLYRPIPQRLQKPVLVLEDSPMPRTPSPVRVTSPTSPTISRNIILGGASAGFQLRHRRSSSASIAGEGGAWNLMSMKLTEPRLHGGETSEVQVCVNEEKDIGASGSDSHLMQLYSSSKDVLDELYKIIRNNKPYPLNINQLSTTSPLYRATSPLYRVTTPHHRRQPSDASSTTSRENDFSMLVTRSPPAAVEWAKRPFPSSPISRTTMRNPIIYNSQFKGE